jgi:hypothetical protein
MAFGGGNGLDFRGHQGRCRDTWQWLCQYHISLRQNGWRGERFSFRHRHGFGRWRWSDHHFSRNKDRDATC